MLYDPQRPRHSLRLATYDYATPGAYFLTMLLRERAPLLGTLREGRMLLSDVGVMVVEVWREITGSLPGIRPDAFVVMPDHVHFLVWIVAGDGVRRLDGWVRSRCAERPPGWPVRRSETIPLAHVVHAFKGISTTRYIRQVHAGRCPPIQSRLWRRDHYERIIRDERHLEATRRYIRLNPERYRGPFYA